MARTRPYLFYDVALSICSTCYRKLEGKIIFQDDRVFLLKRCPDHGSQKTLIADDVDYYRRCREVFLKPPEMPLVYNTPVRWGCPYDCGLCTDHEQHSCLTLVEICDYCNLRCPVCYASSGPERQQFRSLAQIEFMLDAVVRNEGHPDVVQLSGGEPTLHPDFFAIIALCKARPIKHLMVNTNGVRIAQDESFVQQLAAIKEDFEIYLQFDSFEREPLMQLRGADLRRVREDALEKLNRYNISTNLVVTLMKGLNDHEIGKTIDYALQQPCVRGVTFQPIQDAGRLDSCSDSRIDSYGDDRLDDSCGDGRLGRQATRSERPTPALSSRAEQDERAAQSPAQSRDLVSPSTTEGAPPFFSRTLRKEGGDFDSDSPSNSPGAPALGRTEDFPAPAKPYNPATDRMTLTEVRRKILEQTKVFRPEDVIPVPCHPDSLAMAYALKLNGKVIPLTSMIPPEVLINGAKNTILYEQEPAVRDNLFKLFATNHSPQSSAGTLRDLLCCLPQVFAPDHISYNNIFRVIIMQFLDAHSFDVRSVKKTCVHIVHPDGRLIPFDTYNLFYRDHLEQTRLAPLRAAAASSLTSLTSP